MNLKPFLYHSCLVVVGTGIIGASWHTSRNEIVFVTFLLMLLLHYLGGFLLTNHHSWYKNLVSVLFVFMFNYMLFIYSQVYNNELQSLMDIIFIVFKFPFLYILGWQGPNYPLFVTFLPSVLLWLGLESKLIIKSIRKKKHS